MKQQYLFPFAFKKVGWYILIPAIGVGFLSLFSNFHPNVLNCSLPSLELDTLFSDKPLFKTINNNILNEISGILVIVGGVFVAFSKEKQEDEYLSKIRLDSLVWAVYLNSGILLLSFLLFYDFSFYWVMVFNMFTVLLFFIIRFKWQISKLKLAQGNEE